MHEIRNTTEYLTGNTGNPSPFCIKCWVFGQCIEDPSRPGLNMVVYTTPMYVIICIVTGSFKGFSKKS